MCLALPVVEFMLEKLLVILLVLWVPFWFLPVELLFVVRLPPDLRALVGSAVGAGPSFTLLWSLITLHMILATSRNLLALNFRRIAYNSDFWIRFASWK